MLGIDPIRNLCRQGIQQGMQNIDLAKDLLRRLGGDAKYRPDKPLLRRLVGDIECGVGQDCEQAFGRRCEVLEADDVKH